jgi:hypothetical protein
MFKRIAFTSAAFVLCCLPANAQKSNFVNLGFDKDGNPVLIDTESIRGDNFALYQSKGGRMIEMLFDASCPAGRVWLRRMTIYSGSGTKLAEDTDLKEMPASADTPPGAGLRYFCRSFKVPGY